MEYVKAYSQPPRGPLLLEEGADRDSVTGECRDAALTFLRGVTAGWDKLDLVLWLTGPYAGATRHVPRGERVAGLDLDEETDVEEETIDDLLFHVREQMLADLEGASLDGGVFEAATRSIDRGHVRRAVDETGDEVWVPVDLARMRLRDRVVSLFSADFLNDGLENGRWADLLVCPRCESVVFDENAKRLGLCGLHRRASGIVPRGPADEQEAHELASGDDE